MYRIEQIIKEGKLFYTIDLVDGVHIIDVYEMNAEVAEELSPRIEGEWQFVVLNVKNEKVLNYKGDNTVGQLIGGMKEHGFDSYFKGETPEFSILREGDLSLKFDFRNPKHNPQLHKYKVRSTIQEYSKGKRVLNMFPGISDLSVVALKGGATHVTEFKDFTLQEQSDFLKNLNDADLDKIEQIDGDFETALKNLEEPYQRFELILADLSVLERFFPEAAKSFKEGHKDTIRNLQHMQLEPNGILILVSDDLEFHLDGYIRPGADRLTKYLSGAEYGEQKMFHAYAFYK